MANMIPLRQYILHGLTVDRGLRAFWFVACAMFSMATSMILSTTAKAWGPDPRDNNSVEKTEMISMPEYILLFATITLQAIELVVNLGFSEALPESH